MRLPARCNNDAAGMELLVSQQAGNPSPRLPRGVGGCGPTEMEDCGVGVCGHIPSRGQVSVQIEAIQS